MWHSFIVSPCIVRSASQALTPPPLCANHCGVYTECLCYAQTYLDIKVCLCVFVLGFGFCL